MRRFCIFGITIGIGCSGEIPEQLEAIGISGLDEGLTARFEVTGSDREYSFTGEDGTPVIDVHSPTDAPLAGLDGRELTFEVWRELDLDFRASDGAPLWLAARTGATVLVDDWFGEGFAQLGPRVARESIGDDVRRDHHMARFETDLGQVDLLPGEVDTITLDGVLWRVGVVAAYHDEDIHHGNAKCYTYQTTLSYELLRVDAEVEPELVGRDPELELARTLGGCG